MENFIPGKTYLPATMKLLSASDLEYAKKAIDDGWLTSGRWTKEFETFFSLNVVGCSGLPGSFVNSGSSANLCAISAAYSLRKVKSRNQVITAACGFPTTVNPIFQNGAEPVFVDIERDTLNVSIDTIKEATTERTAGVALAHTLGNPFRSDLVREWCDKNGLFFVEDCCDALMAVVGNKACGSFGDYSTFSFYPAHHITTGEGGMVLSKDRRHKLIVERFRDWGRDCWCDTGCDNTCGKRFEYQKGDLPHGYDHKYTYSEIGYNLKATDIQAAIGVSQLDRALEFVETRVKNFKYLKSLLKEYIGTKIFVPAENWGCVASWFGFPITVGDGVDRLKLVRFLEEKKIGTRLLFGGNLTKQPAYKNRTDYKIHGSLKNSDHVMNNTFWIGCHPGLGLKELEYVASIFQEFFSDL